MYRFLVFFLMLSTFIACSKRESGPPTPVVIPPIFDGAITEFSLTPLDINTPDKGTFVIFANNTSYRVDFDATSQSQSNATLTFASDTILNDQSREFANLGQDAIAYFPVEDNRIVVSFTDGRRVTGLFNSNSSFGGVFGQALISQWRDTNDPSKPTQKAKEDIINLVHRYSDKDGPGPETAPLYLFAKVSVR
ncbi:MAG: hypothetical protein ABIN24_12095 [Dyadobacter sp.]